RREALVTSRTPQRRRTGQRSSCQHLTTKGKSCPADRSLIYFLQMFWVAVCASGVLVGFAEGDDLGLATLGWSVPRTTSMPSMSTWRRSDLGMTAATVRAAASWPGP